MDISFIAGTIESLKAAGGLVKGLLDAKEEGAVKAKTSELLNALLEVQLGFLQAQQEMQKLIDENKHLSDELDSLRALASYQLVEPYPGTKLYRSVGDVSVQHYICPKCKAERQIASILQGNSDEDEYLTCNTCQAGYRISPRRPYQEQRYNPYA